MATVRKRKWTHNGQDKEAWVVAYTDQGGKRRIKTFEKKRDADRQRVKIESEIEGGIHVADRETLTVKQVAEEYLNHCDRQRKLGRISGNTLVHYNSSSKHVVANLGALRVTEIESQSVQEKLDGLHGKYAAATVGHIYATLWNMLRFAVRKKWLRRNPLSDEPVTLPKKPRQKMNFPSKADLRLLLEATMDRDGTEQRLTYVNRKLAVCLGMFGGLRIGEVFGLQWECVDFDNSEIHVAYSFSKYDGLKAPKSEAGNRVVPMTPPIREALIDVLRYRRAERAAVEEFAGASMKRDSVLNRMRRAFDDREVAVDLDDLPTGGVILSGGGKPMVPTATKFFWHPVMQKAGLCENGKPKFSFHMLRHVAASLFIEAGLPAMNLRQVMGHSSVQITYNVYGHLFAEDDRVRTAAASIAASLGATRERQISVSD